MELKRTFDFLHFQQNQYPLKNSFNFKKNGEWQGISTENLIKVTNQLSFGLLKAGIKKGDKVAVVSENRPEWVYIDLAVQQIGAVLVPLYPNIRINDYQYIFDQAQVKMIFVSNEEIYDKVSQAFGQTSETPVYSFDEIASCDYWKKMRLSYTDKHLDLLQKYRDAVNETDLLTIIYTSGTTGFPKGVMLTHSNIVFNVKSCDNFTKIKKGKFNAFSFLPLNHIFERSMIYYYLYAGGSVFFASSMDKIGEEIKEAKPHVFNTVPRLLEKVYDKILTKASTLGTVKKSIFNWAVSLGLKYEPDKKMSGLYSKQLAVADKLVFSKWREALGGNLVQIQCGAAALQPRLIRVFWAAGIKVLEGYGLTETSPIVSANALDSPKVGTVGEPIDGVEVKIAKDGEILVKGPNVMLGYYKNDQLTKEVIEDDWLHTGDVGEINGGYLRITDRKKEMFKTSGGLYIAPQVSENKLKESSLIDQVMVIGDGKKFPSALIVPSFSKALEIASKRFILVSGNEELMAHKDIRKVFEKELEQLNKNLGKWEQIKQFRLLTEPWSVESGELTATLKMKRKVIMEKYDHIIRDIYKDDGADVFKDVEENQEIYQELVEELT
ncbi:MAG: long-chain fatty acid--CoA ligase [Cyclobacteriaceae bacterium]